MKNKALVFWLAVLFVFAGATIIWTGWRQWVGANAVTSAGSEVLPGDVKPPGSTEPILKEFTLTDQLGQPFDSQSLDGKVWVASFFFASCPQICRMQNMQVARIQNKYADRGVELVSITCDPQRDTPAALASYAELFNAQPEHWHFLTGDLLYIRRIGAEIFQVAVEEETHSDRLLVIDRDGKIRGSYRATKPEQFAALESTLDELLEQAGGAVADQQALEESAEDETTTTAESAEADDAVENNVALPSEKES